jgi:hypothetical protein
MHPPPLRSAPSPPFPVSSLPPRPPPPPQVSRGRFSEDRARFYSGEIILAIEHLHEHNIVCVE